MTQEQASTSGTGGGDDPEFIGAVTDWLHKVIRYYPGDDFVDRLGVDVYPDLYSVPPSLADFPATPERIAWYGAGYDAAEQDTACEIAEWRELALSRHDAARMWRALAAATLIALFIVAAT